jgi:hypothetical protein
MAKVRLIKHEAVPQSGSFEICFPDGRPSKYVYWEDDPGRAASGWARSSSGGPALARIFARAEQHALNQARR